MHAVIVGAGELGVTVARRMVSAGHEIAVIDLDRSRREQLDEALGGVSIAGDGTEATVLSRAGANRAEALIATTGRDDVNLVACQLAKHRFGVVRTIALVNAREHSDLFDTLGVDVVVDVSELALGRIQEGLSSQGIVHLMPVSESDEKALVAVRIPLDTGTEGRLLSELPLPDGTLVSLIIGRDGNASVPDSATLIRAGDEVVAVTRAYDEEALKDVLVNGAGE